MSGGDARSHWTAAVTGALAVVLLGALLCGCATSGRQCTGPLEPINGPAESAAPDQRDEP
jgi:hypothetical protein